MKRLACHAFIIAILAGGGAALAAGGGDDPNMRGWDTKAVDPTVAAAQKRFVAQDWTGAKELLANALARSPQNADYHNLYAYAIRKGPSPDMDLVFRHYNEALRIDPKHLGAHEYLGEAYLMQKNVAKANEHLAQLSRLCGSCDEYVKLKRAIADFEQAKK
jgi:cytochrome c-type biogenesis protein CcmH/NrfG